MGKGLKSTFFISYTFINYLSWALSHSIVNKSQKFEDKQKFQI